MEMDGDSHHGCSMCSFFSCSQDVLINHVIRRHRHDKNFMIHCSHPTCGLSFRNLHSFKSHAYRIHRNDNVYVSDLEEGTDADLTTVEADNAMPHSSSADAVYILKLKARHRLSQTAVADICESTRELFHAKLTEALESGNVDDPDSIVSTLFSDLQTSNKQERFFAEHFGFVSPQSKTLGTTTAVVIKKGNKRRLVERDVLGYYVPVKEQLSALLSMPEVQQCLENRPANTSDSDYLYDFCDGQYVRDHATNGNSTALQLCLYMDDFEVVNPIGYHRKKHKITAFYWTLLNIPPENRSRLSSIQLLAMAKTVDLRKFGITLLLEDLVSALEQLEHGVQFCLPEFGVKLYYGFLVCVLADTPAAQLLGGFKEGVGSAVSPCRSCDVKRSQLAQIFTGSECPLRDQQEHTDRVKFLELQNKKAFKYWSKHWGVNGPSVLSISGFDVTKCILHDPMHVILEGVAKVELKALLKYFIYEKKYFTLKFFNDVVQNYTYTNDELKDKPEVIDKKAFEHSAVFPQTAAAMKNLLTNLPFIIADDVPDDDEHWRNFLLLLQILVLSITPVISWHTPITLAALIPMHQKNFLALYSENLFTPKFHYLVHFPQQMQLFGPLRNHWCMRFESKNGFFKLQRWFNYRNLPKSLSFYHQNWMCLQMTQTSGSRSSVYLYSGDTVTSGVVVSLARLPQMSAILADDVGIDQLPSCVLSSSHVVVSGLTYGSGTVLLENVDNVQFVEVESVIVHEQVKYLYCHCLTVLQFDSHRNAFKVQKTDKVSVLRITSLQYRWPQVVHRTDDNYYISMQSVEDVWIL